MYNANEDVFRKKCNSEIFRDINSSFIERSHFFSDFGRYYVLLYLYFYLELSFTKVLGVRNEFQLLNKVEESTLLYLMFA